MSSWQMEFLETGDSLDKAGLENLSKGISDDIHFIHRCKPCTACILLGVQELTGLNELPLSKYFSALFQDGIVSAFQF